MKEFHSKINRKLYFSFTLVIIVIMVSGLLIGGSRFSELTLGYSIHFILVVLLSVLLLLYPVYETYSLRLMIILFGSAYFYNLFFTYPETWSTFILIAFIPASSILFFDSKLFYFTYLLNGLLIFLTLLYVLVVDQGSLYPYLYTDFIGNIINILAAQIVLFLIFYISLRRIQKQQHYYEKLQQAERLKMTGQLTAAVAHEIRNPLTVVKGFLQLCKEDDDRDSSKDKFDLMIDELNVAEEVISQFLTLAKPDKGQLLENVDVKVVLESVTSLLNSYGMLYDNQVHIDVEEKCYISVNKIEFKQLIINLIKNSIEASNVGKSVTVTAKKGKGFVEINIIDEGTGMSGDEIKSLGTPFYSLKSKGTGLGLMICFNIIEKYNGKIQYTSTIGKGTTVTIRFPAVKEHK